ncbi:hypothetical protein EJ03DRAFT_353064 [Teratosphaeria nubilosa]|uniref:Retrovirus-related Pol polyprotein from transposon TNT 1-94-like beta-barrel domain-containing protein n=1 Tax=Teratosphaeria nubilosa TaxID=161662 RepID=A0A6G1L4C6_9PEZI|nr:hypothetical protein EJ03DRAFT_353064 [Teratosphaeria nubilosa]
MAPTGEAYNTDWLYASTCNVHIATHRDWFTTYTAFPSHLRDATGTHLTPVSGIGTVDLSVRKLVGEAAKKGPPKNKNSTITLRNVLYAPDLMCNVLGKPVTDEYDVSIGAERWLMDKRNGAGVGLLDRNEAGWTKVVLKGQAKGDSRLGKAVDGKWLQAVWPEEERRRWEAEGGKLCIADEYSSPGSVEVDPATGDLEYPSYCLALRGRA